MRDDEIIRGLCSSPRNVSDLRLLPSKRFPETDGGNMWLETFGLAVDLGSFNVHSFLGASQDIL